MMYRPVAGTTLAFVLVSLSGACTPKAEAPDPLPAACAAEDAFRLANDRACLGHADRSWLQADLHVHSVFSTDTDWSRPSTLERLREVALARGLSFLLITDHSNSTGSEPHCRDHPEPNDCVEQPHLHNLGSEFPAFVTARSLSDDRIEIVQGNEASPVDLDTLRPRGHVNVMPRDPETFDTTWIIEDRPSAAVAGGWAIAAAQQHAAFVILNHPYSPGGATPWIEYDWTSFGYDAIEVYNASAGFDEGDQAGFEALLCDWSQGRHVAAVGASDNHRWWIEHPGDLLNPALGAARTSLLVDGVRWGALVEAFGRRHTVAHDPESFLEFRVTLADGTRLLPGDVHPLAAATAVEVAVGGWSEPGGAIVLAAVADGACSRDRRGVADEDWRVVVAWTELARQALPETPGEAVAFRWRGSLAPGTTLAAWVDRERRFMQDRGQAIPTPVRLSPPP